MGYSFGAGAEPAAVGCVSRQLVNLRLPPELVARVDERAGELGQTRTMFVERALESALGCSDAIAETGSVERASGPGRAAPSRAPVPGVRPARELLREGVDMDRQARVNALRAKKK